MIVYLAARYGRIEEMRQYREELRALGVVVFSRWIDGGLDDNEANATTAERVMWAQENLADLRDVDAIITFTEPEGAPGASRGGRHVEFGYALALRRLRIERRPPQIYVVGPPENIYHSLPGVDDFESWAECLQYLTEWQERRALVTPPGAAS